MPRTTYLNATGRASRTANHAPQCVRSACYAFALVALMLPATAAAQSGADSGRAAGIEQPIRCPELPGFLVDVGSLTLRFPGSDGWRPLDEHQRVWVTLPPCGDGRRLRIGSALLINAPSPNMLSIPFDCIRPGQPPARDRFAACGALADEPQHPFWGRQVPEEGSRPIDAHQNWVRWRLAWRHYVVAGLPETLLVRGSDMGSDGRWPGQDVAVEEDWVPETVRGSLPFVTPEGNTGFVRTAQAVGTEPEGPVVYRLQRGPGQWPLIVRCGSARWPIPETAPAYAKAFGARCRVATTLAPGVSLHYEFRREFFDEPDWLALDERVRTWVMQRAAPGQETTP